MLPVKLSDLRNSNVIKIVERLKKFQCKISLTDEFADKNEVKDYFSHDLLKLEDVKNQDVIIVAVEHEHYKKVSKIRIGIGF